MSHNLNKWHDFGKKIEKYIRPSTFPLVFKILGKNESFPEECRRPKRDFGVKIFLCQAIKMSRTYGWTIGLNLEDNACQISSTLFNWMKVSLEQAKRFLSQFMVGLYSSNKRVAENYLSKMTFLQEDNNGIVISPLSWTKVEPTMLAIYCNPAQVMRLTQSYLYSDEKLAQIMSSCSGRAGTCHDGIVQTILTNSPRIVVPGNGDRVWGMAQDNEMLFTIPAGKVEQLIYGLEKTHKAGLRYPIPSYMRFKPGFQINFEKKAIERAGGTIASQND
ncbi:MAG: DUF169 domain-containing protein [Candidatus Helarchaeota archaeon]